VEPTLALQKKDYEAEVGDFLGYGRGELFGDTAWTSEQAATCERLGKSGLRQFYKPPIVPGESTAYAWSFLQQVTTVTTTADSPYLDMPADFGHPVGELFVVDSDRITVPVKFAGGLVRRLLADFPDRTGPPEVAELLGGRQTTAERGQRWQVRLYPTPDAAYTLQVRYTLSPAALSGETPYAYGGPDHAETILASCVAAAEVWKDNQKGPMWDHFLTLLAASVSRDRELKPQLFGYNGDASDCDWLDGYRGRWRTENGVTVNGVQY
jgi:hypothetical protein